MNNEKLFGYIGKLKNSDIQFTFKDISEGDRYNSEQGAEYLFQILDNKYSVGYVYITEDDDDWAQPECYQHDWCRCNGEDIKPEEVYKLIENYKSIVRDNKLESILK